MQWNLLIFPAEKQTRVSPPTSILDIAQDVKRPFPHNLCKHPTKSKKEILPPLCDSRFSCPSSSLSRDIILLVNFDLKHVKLEKC